MKQISKNAHCVECNNVFYVSPREAKRTRGNKPFCNACGSRHFEISKKLREQVISLRDLFREQ